MMAWDKHWILNADVRLQGSKDPAPFWLEKKTVGSFVFYLVKFNGTDMNAMWKNAVLFPWGDKPLTRKGDLLPRWSQAEKQRYLDAIDADLSGLGPDTELLVGRVLDGKEPLWVTFFQIPDAIDDGSGRLKTLLAVRYNSELKMTSADGAAPNDDGTGHGNDP